MISNIFSRRQKIERGEFPDVYQYKDIPEKVRMQIKLISDSFFVVDGANQEMNEFRMGNFQYIVKNLCEEYGIHQLKNEPINSRHPWEPYYELMVFFLETSEYEKALDVIEYVCLSIISYAKDNSTYRQGNFKEIIDRINQRLREAGVGYQFERNRIIRVDSEIIHSEVVKPVLSLLNNEKYKSVNDEFLTAHEHYRHRRFKESTTECCKAFESLLKIICKNRGWEYKQKDPASKLITIVLQNGLVPTYMLDQFNLMDKLLRGLPTVRNKNAAHGQGNTIKPMPEYFASYALHLTATTLKFLMEADLSK